MDSCWASCTQFNRVDVETHVFEYCLVSGNDWWDVLVRTKRESIEMICDKFLDAYERQPKSVQRKYFNRHLMIRVSLYRCNTLRSMVHSQDQDPPHQLASFFTIQGMQTNHFTCNNASSKINEKE